jgi:hypothetical protein
MNRQDKIKMVEGIVKGLVKEFELTPAEIMIGVHNASVHGEIYEGGVDFGKEDELLAQFFEGMEKSIEAANKME